MEITKDNSIPEYPHIYFSGEFDCCALALNTQSIWLRFYIGSTLDEHILLSQEDVKALLPYLQSFAKKGTLEPQESPLQGEDHTLEQLSNFEEGIQKAQRQETKDSLLCCAVTVLLRFTPDKVKEKALHLLTVYNSEERIPPSPLQGENEKGKSERASELDFVLAKHIGALEQLVREWRIACQYLALISETKFSDLQKKTAQLLNEEE